VDCCRNKSSLRKDCAGYPVGQVLLSWLVVNNGSDGWKRSALSFQLFWQHVDAEAPFVEQSGVTAIRHHAVQRTRQVCLQHRKDDFGNLPEKFWTNAKKFLDNGTSQDTVNAKSVNLASHLR
jgi:hypothetical protein